MTAEKMIEPHVVFVPGDRVAYRVIGDEVVIVEPNANRLVQLNTTASWIWSHLDGRTVAALAEALTVEFDVEPTAALQDVVDFIMKMRDKALIEPADK